MNRIATGTALMWLAGVVVAAAVVAGLLVTGSPQQQRLARLDEVRLMDLDALERAVLAYHERNDRLPADLDELATHPGIRVPLQDPAGHPPYRYRMIDASRFELCATFDTDTLQAQGAPMARDRAHAKGEQCFPRRVPKRESQATPPPGNDSATIDAA